MIVLDAETLSLESTAVVLSIGAVYWDNESEVSYQKLLDTGCFIKLNAKEQMSKYKRVIDKDTVDWWAKQALEVRQASLIPSDDDVDLATGMEMLRTWCNKIPDFKNEIVWHRGILDPACIDSLTRVLKIKPVIPHASWRDVRTGVELINPNTRNGYCEVNVNEVRDYDRFKVMRHHPVHDSAEDLCMIVRGVQ